MLLRDFTYERLTPLPGPGQGVGELRDADWYVDWLAGDSTGSFQPYQQLARVPASYGANATARTVLVAGRASATARHCLGGRRSAGSPRTRHALFANSHGRMAGCDDEDENGTGQGGVGGLSPHGV